MSTPRNQWGRNGVEVAQPLPVVIQHSLGRPTDATIPYAEVDVVVSQDGVPFVHRNYQVGPRFAFSMPCEQIREAGLQPLEDFLGEARSLGILENVMLDVRSGFQDDLVPHKAIVSVLERSGWDERALLVDWDWQQATALRDCAHGARSGAAIRGRLPHLNEALARDPIDYLFMDWSLVRRADVEVCHAHGVTVGTFEGWDASFYPLAIEVGVDFVLSDRPETCRSALESCAD